MSRADSKGTFVGRLPHFKGHVRSSIADSGHFLWHLFQSASGYTGLAFLAPS